MSSLLNLPTITLVGQPQVVIGLDGVTGLVLPTSEVGKMVLRVDAQATLALRAALDQLVMAFAHPQGRA